MPKIKVKRISSEIRLDKFLMEKYPGRSRSQIQNRIKEGAVSVNDKKVSAHYILKEGDEINILSRVKPGMTARYDNSKEEAEIIKNLPKIEIVDETDEYLVINKPAGLIVHGGEGIKEKTLVDILLPQYPLLSKLGEDPARPGIVHRLDKEASGLMVIPKTQESFDNIKKQFQKRTVNKRYAALVYGRIEKDEDEIRFPIKRSASGHRMAALPETVKGEKTEEGRVAISEFEIEKRFINYTLIKVKIKTGRTHQIRVHLSAYAHPLVGDDLYGTKKTKELNKKLGINRIFLAASELSFKNLQGEEKSYKIKLPGELNEILKKIK